MMAAETLLPAADTPQAQRVAEPAASIPAPAGQTEAGRSVALQVVAAVLSDGDGRFELQLSPEELGTVRLSLQVSDGAVALAIHAERPETLDLVRRHLDILERELQDAGFTSLTFTFGQGSTDSRKPAAPGYADAIGERSADPGPAAVAPARAGSLRSSSHLDLRL